MRGRVGRGGTEENRWYCGLGQSVTECGWWDGKREN